jgi:isocitrate dehydrogenase
MISSRGTQVYPATGAITDTVDQFRCRLLLHEPGELSDEAVFDVLRRVSSRHRWMHIEKLQEFDGEPGFTRAQGEN